MNYTAKKAKYKHLLEGLFLFRNIPQEVVDAVYNSPACECVEFFSGEMVFTQNQYRRSLGIVVSGELRATKNGANTIIILNSFSQGGVFGAAGLFSDMEGYVSEIQAIRKSKVLFCRKSCCILFLWQCLLQQKTISVIFPAGSAF